MRRISNNALPAISQVQNSDTVHEMANSVQLAQPGLHCDTLQLNAPLYGC